MARPLRENKAQPAELLFFVGAKIALFAKEFAEQTRQLVEVFRYRRLDDHVAHRRWLFHNRPIVAMGLSLLGSAAVGGGLEGQTSRRR